MHNLWIAKINKINSSISIYQVGSTKIVDFIWYGKNRTWKKKQQQLYNNMKKRTVTDILTYKMELIKCDKKNMFLFLFSKIQRNICYERNRNKHKNELRKKIYKSTNVKVYRHCYDRDHLPETESGISSMLSNRALNCTSD